MDLDNVTADCGDHQVLLALDSLQEFCVDRTVTIIIVLVVIFLVLIILGLVLYMCHKVIHRKVFTFPATRVGSALRVGCDKIGNEAAQLYISGNT